MSYSTLRYLDFTDLATAADANQLRANLTALVGRWGRGAGPGVFNVSFDVITGATYYHSPAGTAVQVVLPNSPARTNALLVLSGILRINLASEEVFIGLHFGTTPNAVTTTPLRQQRFQATAGSLTYNVPIYLQARVAVPVGTYYAYPQVYCPSGADAPVTGSNRFTGHLFIKEI